MYRSVEELNQNELEELRSRLFHQLLDDGSLDEVMGKEVNEEEEIPMDFVKTHYADISFVEEDFWCNLNNLLVERRLLLVLKSDLKLPGGISWDFLVV